MLSDQELEEIKALYADVEGWDLWLDFSPTEDVEDEFALESYSGPRTYDGNVCGIDRIAERTFYTIHANENCWHPDAPAPEIIAQIEDEKEAERYKAMLLGLQKLVAEVEELRERVAAQAQAIREERDFHETVAQTRGNLR